MSRVRRFQRVSIRRAALLAAALIAGSSQSAIADNAPLGDIPDNQAFVVHHGAGYSLKVPEGWPSTTRSGATTFTHAYNGITVVVAHSAKAPTVASEKAELAKLKATIKGFAHPAVSVITRAGGSGVLVRYQAASAPSPVTGTRIKADVERYELWRGGREAVITLQAPHGSDNVDAWKLVTSSFRWSG
jgi:hypothetical protein